MQRVVMFLLMCLPLGACGVGETAVSAAAGSASEIQQAKDGLKTEARVKQQLDDAAALEGQRRHAAEAEAQ